jgi:hypothetical protein
MGKNRRERKIKLLDNEAGLYLLRFYFEMFEKDI